MSKEKFQNEFLELVGELGNMTFGNASTALSMLVNQPIDISTPRVEVVTKEELIKSFPNPYVLVEVQYAEGLEGHNVLLLEPRDAFVIANLMMGGDGNAEGELGELELSAVQEAMNQMMGSASTAMSGFLNKTIDICPPNTTIVELENDTRLHELFPDEHLIQVCFDLTIGELVYSNVMQIINIPFARKLASELLGIS
ncbi:flagellar motor switch phosphatase FliY [Bacillus toyonensis]|uniref:flagellar motor switch phosphatase FliY n=1 Tax=Bacillus toyonensis TaxID=155322 RepID=UPI002E251825|nr:flagellar motor switch phosphatase FliY [Bacillus toyonensis]MED2737737.1 flagellar motor switch phosphatase FliY [Bacillus toyonensis]